MPEISEAKQESGGFKPHYVTSILKLKLTTSFFLNNAFSLL